MPPSADNISGVGTVAHNRVLPEPATPYTNALTVLLDDNVLVDVKVGMA